MSIITKFAEEYTSGNFAFRSAGKTRDAKKTLPISQFFYHQHNLKPWVYIPYLNTTEGLL